MKIGSPVQLASLAAVPWKNGGGITRSLAVEPANAGFDDFLWRLSFAEVSAASQFSSFPGVDRTLLLWRGNGMRLKPQSGNGNVVTLSHPLDAYSFPGEDEIEAELIDGPTTDFNVMVRRGRASAEVQRHHVKEVVSHGAQQGFFVCAKGRFRLHFPSGEGCVLAAEEVLHISHLIAGTQLLPETAGSALVSVLIDLPDPAA